MNRKVIAIIFSLLLAVSSIPAQVFATDDVTASVSSNSIEDENEDEGQGEYTDPEVNETDGGQDESSSDNDVPGDEAPASGEDGSGISSQEEQQDIPVEQQEQQEMTFPPVQSEITFEEQYAETPAVIFEEYTEAEIIEEQAVEEIVEQAEVLTVEEEEWLTDHNLELNDDGDYEYTDEEGHKQKFTPGDPEVYKYFGDTDEKEITLGDNRVYLRPGSEYYDPYVFKLNQDYKYRYPSYFRSDNREDRPEVHYGMDVSKYQGKISTSHYRKLRKDYGIDFVIVRVGYRGYGENGTLNTDSCYKENIKNAYKAGLAVGVYYFSQAISEEEAEEEAEHAMELIEPYRKMVTLPVITDFEYSGSPGRLRGAHLDSYEQTEIVNAFCERVQEEGYIPGIYANKSMLLRDMEISEIPEDYHIWMANFVGFDEDGVGSTSYGERLSSWQFTSKFSGFGDRGLQYMKGTYLDLNFWYGDFPEKDEDEDTVSSNDADEPEDAEEIEEIVEDEVSDDAGQEMEEPEAAPDPEESGRIEELNEETVPEEEQVSANTEGAASESAEAEDTVEEEYPEGSGDILITRAEVTGLQSEFIYTGKEITQSGYELRCVRKWGEVPTLLKEGKDYTVSYENNVDAGWNRAKIIFKGKGDFMGTVTKRYTIKPVEFSKDGAANKDIRVSMDENVPYTRGGTRPVPKITFISGDSELVLEEERDYTLKYYNNRGAGGENEEDVRPFVLISGEGNYKGELAKYFSILPPDISDGDMTISDSVYVRKAGSIKPKIKVYAANGARLVGGIDYEKTPKYFYEEIQDGSMIEHYEKGHVTKLDRSPGDEVGPDDIVPAGTVLRAEIIGKGKYSGSKISRTFRIVEAE